MKTRALSISRELRDMFEDWFFYNWEGTLSQRGVTRKQVEIFSKPWILNSKFELQADDIEQAAEDYFFSVLPAIETIFLGGEND